MKNFEVKGTFNHNGVNQKFTKLIKASDDKGAKELVYTLIGGKQKIQRRNINILEIAEAKE